MSDTAQVVDRAKRLGIEQGRREEGERIITMVQSRKKASPSIIYREACDDILAAFEELKDA